VVAAGLFITMRAMGIGGETSCEGGDTIAQTLLEYISPPIRTLYDLAEEDNQDVTSDAAFFLSSRIIESSEFFLIINGKTENQPFQELHLAVDEM
jgi:hypothetical protein